MYARFINPFTCAFGRGSMEKAGTKSFSNSLTKFERSSAQLLSHVSFDNDLHVFGGHSC